MKDAFEKYIAENKTAFDEHKADRAKLWAGIEAQLEEPGPKVVPLWRSAKWRVAAGIVLIAGLLVLFGLILGRGTSYDDPKQLVDQELQEIDMYYQNLVAHQVQLVQDHPGLADEDKTEFLEFMDELDEEYLVLRQEMERNLDNERVLEAIVANYKKRIELIENLLRQINESKKSEDEDVYIL